MRMQAKSLVIIWPYDKISNNQNNCSKMVEIINEKVIFVFVSWKQNHANLSQKKQCALQCTVMTPLNYSPQMGQIWPIMTDG